MVQRLSVYRLNQYLKYIISEWHSREGVISNPSYVSLPLDYVLGDGGLDNEKDAYDFQRVYPVRGLPGRPELVLGCQSEACLVRTDDVYVSLLRRRMR